MSPIITPLTAVFKALDVTAVYVPVVALAEAGRIDLPALARSARSPSPMSDPTRTTLRAYLRPFRPEHAALIFDGRKLGAEVPLSEGAWCVVEHDEISIFVPHGLPHTICSASVGRRLGDLVEIEGMERMPYPISGVAIVEGLDGASYDVVRATVPLIEIVDLVIRRSV